MLSVSSSVSAAGAKVDTVFNTAAVVVFSGAFVVVPASDEMKEIMN